MGFLGKKVLENYVPRGKVKVEDDDGETVPDSSVSSVDVPTGVEGRSQAGQTLSLRRHSDHPQKKHNSDNSCIQLLYARPHYYKIASTFPSRIANAAFQN